MRGILDQLDKFLDSPLGGIASFALVFAVRALWPKLTSAARKAAPPTRKKGAKHHNHKHATPTTEKVEPGVGL